MINTGKIVFFPFRSEHETLQTEKVGHGGKKPWSIRKKGGADYYKFEAILWKNIFSNFETYFRVFVLKKIFSLKNTLLKTTNLRLF